jgi:hypothetical protein
MSSVARIGGGALVALLLLAGACARDAEPPAPEAAGTTTVAAPEFTFDPTWPKLPLPNEWILGEVGGVDVDARGHVWVIQRPWTVFGRELAAVSGEAHCCRPAPSVIELDQEGNVVQAWPDLETFHAEPGTPAGQGFEVGGRGEDLWQSAAGPGDVWGADRREHTVYVDHADFVWVTLDEAHVIYKFTRDGRHVMTIGRKGERGGSNDTTRLGRPAGLIVDPETNELYVSDGYDNRRVIVFDAETGAYRRHWGAYGNAPDDELDLGPYDPASPSPQFRGPVHGIDLSLDGLIYVADRSANRIQVFRRDGTFVQEGLVAPMTRDLGTAYGVVVSPDQRWVYVNDGSNNKIWILGREDLVTVGSLSSYGRNAGQIMSGHSMAVDPQGNLYVGETRGRRVQRWLLRGAG